MNSNNGDLDLDHQDQISQSSSLNNFLLFNYTFKLELCIAHLLVQKQVGVWGRHVFCDCKKNSLTSLFCCSPQCDSVYFCSSVCRMTAFSCTSSYSHKDWCSKMAGYMTFIPELASFPFTYTSGIYHG